MLCDTPIPSAPKNEVPAAWNGVTGNGVAGCPSQRTSAATASTPNGASTAATNQPDAVPTTRVPRRLSQVAPQISASATSQPSSRPSRGRKKCRYCRSEEHTSELQSLRHLVCRLL